MAGKHETAGENSYTQLTLLVTEAEKSPWGMPKALRTPDAIPDRKRCSRCKREKPGAAFAVRYGRLESWCRECRRAWQNERYRLNPPEPGSRRFDHIRRTYGISKDAYHALFEEQNGVCAICRQPEHRKGGRQGKTRLSLAVDHDHSTGQIRGLLCSDCNTGLGLFLHSEELLISAIEYLRHNTSSQSTKVDSAGIFMDPKADEASHNSQVVRSQ